LNIQQLGLPLIIIYTCSSIGGIGGGWLSSFFLKIGRSVDQARKTTVLIMALMVVPVFFLSYLSNLWIAVLLMSMATAAHQGWASNIFTIVSDIYPRKAVGSVTGLAGFAGAVGGILFAPLVGFILEATGSYYIVFAYASLSYLLVWLILKIFIPRIVPIDLKEITTKEKYEI
jgi:ACS family hexuronate transporter-like MFS transporter